MGGEPDAHARRSERLDLGEIRANRLLAKAGETAACVRDVQHHELDTCGRRRLDGGKCLGQTEVVELSDCGEAGGPHLAVRDLVRRADELRRLPIRLGEHVLAPGPEVSSGRTAAQRSLKRVAVRVHETRQRKGLGHEARRYQGRHRVHA